MSFKRAMYRFEQVNGKLMKMYKMEDIEVKAEIGGTDRIYFYKDNSYEKITEFKGSTSDLIYASSVDEMISWIHENRYEEREGLSRRERAKSLDILIRTILSSIRLGEGRKELLAEYFLDIGKYELAEIVDML